jgi:hypothetical protein
MQPNQDTPLRFENVNIGDRVRHTSGGFAFDVVSIEPERITATRRMTITHASEWHRDPEELKVGDQVGFRDSNLTFTVLGRNRNGVLIGETTKEITHTGNWFIVVRANKIQESDIHEAKRQEVRTMISLCRAKHVAKTFSANTYAMSFERFEVLVVRSTRP